MKRAGPRSTNWPRTTRNWEFSLGPFHGVLRRECVVRIGAAEFPHASGAVGAVPRQMVGRVHEEWMTALLRNRTDLSREKLERTRMLMDQHAEDALVTGYEDLIEGLHLPDPDDRHVLAAAIRGRADV